MCRTRCALPCRWRVPCRCRMVAVLLSRWYLMSVSCRSVANFPCWTHVDILACQNAMWNVKPAFVCAIVCRISMPYHTTLAKYCKMRCYCSFWGILRLWSDTPKKIRLYHQLTRQSLRCITLTIITHVSSSEPSYPKPIVFCYVSVPFSGNKKSPSRFKGLMLRFCCVSYGAKTCPLSEIQ